MRKIIEKLLKQINLRVYVDEPGCGKHDSIVITPNEAQQLINLYETNKVLHRRCQKLESAIAQNDAYKIGFTAGEKSKKEWLEKRYKRELADYKYSTRKELQGLREQLKHLQHYRDSTIGLWATDRPDKVIDSEGVLFQLKDES